MTRLYRLLFFLSWPALFVYLRALRRGRTRILVVCGGEVLVMMNWISSGRWALPGGGLHRGEAVLAGALRELREETGITANKTDLRFLAEGRVNEYGLPYAYHCFVLKLPSKPPLKRQWYEVARQQWLNYSLLTGRNSEPDTLAAVKSYFKEGSS